MKQTLTTLSIALLALASSAVMADTIIDNNLDDVNSFSNEMSKMEVINLSGGVYVSMESYYLDDVLEVAESITADVQLKKVSDVEAANLGLVPSVSYFVHSKNSIEELSEKASIKLLNDNPQYFSAALLKGDRFLQGENEFIAKITEFSAPK
ncbi:hypothetical protein [Shewanella sp. 10N.286.54.B9]|uniref:hypothetical protein n=1 Tax=Shewanella sp. 10N.286.54.B9 TaxID=3229719 RepID=UPI00354B6246